MYLYFNHLYCKQYRCGVNSYNLSICQSCSGYSLHPLLRYVHLRHHHHHYHYHHHNLLDLYHEIWNRFFKNILENGKTHSRGRNQILCVWNEFQNFKWQLPRTQTHYKRANDFCTLMFKYFQMWIPNHDIDVEIFFPAMNFKTPSDSIQTPNNSTETKYLFPKILFLHIV